MRLTFWGAAKKVTGSMTLLTLDDGYQILIDCGIDMANMTETDPLYPTSALPFDASLVNVVLLTHAHLDHSGKLPNLYKEGFEGQILCTSATASLTQILLDDSARINQRKLKAYSKRKSKGLSLDHFNFIPENLYTTSEVNETMKEVVPIQFKRKFNIKPGLWVTFLPAGHLLGAAHILVEVEENGIQKSFLFSGDIGRKNYPLLQDPIELPQVDYVICETTYGNREHTKIDDSTKELQDVIKRACVDIPGRLIIPAFSIGRTQAVLFELHKLFEAGKLPRIKVFADSPLAMQSNRIYEDFLYLLNQEAKDFKEDYDSLFNFENIEYAQKQNDSKAISNYNEPYIIISSSGMLEGGRIQHHIQANMENPYATVLMVGFSADGTLGARLRDNEGYLRIGNEDLKVNCKIEQTDSFSGHGDVNDLQHFIQQQDKNKVTQIFLNHGEEESMTAFKERIENLGYENVVIPEKGHEFII
ncbi:MBL fold metallo-hydrolase RNA specificity domain-containing protein [Flammeovirga sp. SJP92]|uniref:MBL fold metallo-hydrolase RNA specificity domain-containing protein n=1 Tax=Flammeovirga sp. SJP92 TaxID=1775430 RepID=UPI000788D74F|nr:MBL fold metallo-hydrolase [Flammeovirga sp. SJP92]KXX71045.1 MBL fold metallo-hydrolase [Flammeovirga sp. SJP92]